MSNLKVQARQQIVIDPKHQSVAAFSPQEAFECLSAIGKKHTQGKVTFAVLAAPWNRLGAVENQKVPDADCAFNFQRMEPFAMVANSYGLADNGLKLSAKETKLVDKALTDLKNSGYTLFRYNGLATGSDGSTHVEKIKAMPNDSRLTIEIVLMAKETWKHNFGANQG